MMRFFALVFVTALLVAPEAIASSSAPSLQSPQRLSVTPKTGGTKTTFRIPFTGRLASTRAGHPSNGEHVSYSISAARKSTSHGCAASYSKTVWVAKAHERVTARLDPWAAKRRWCAGHYQGEVTEVITPACSPTKACPEFIAAESIGTFHFTVR
jgi:hypothetical protein